MNSDEQEFLNDLEDREFTSIIQDELTLYRQTGDARFIWKAVILFNEAGRQLPTEFMEKLAQWGALVQDASEPKEIALALELSGKEKQRIGPNNSRAYERRWHVASEVQQVQRLYRTSLTSAIMTVARNRGLSVAKVKKDHDSVVRKPSRNEINKQVKGADIAEIMKRWPRC